MAAFSKSLNDATQVSEVIPTLDSSLWCTVMVNDQRLLNPPLVKQLWFHREKVEASSQGMTEHFIGRWGICTHVQCIMYRDQSVMFATICVFLVIEMETSLHTKSHCVHLEVRTRLYLCANLHV